MSKILSTHISVRIAMLASATMRNPNLSTLTKILLLSLFASMTISYPAFGNSGAIIINASVGVTCPFSVTISPQSIYVQESGASIPYSIKTLTPCTTSATGNLVVTNSLTSTVYDIIPASFSNFGQAPTNGVFTIGPNVLEFGTSDLTFYEASLNTSNSSTGQFQAIGVANLTMLSVSASPPSAQTNSQISVTVNVLNDGSLAANNIVLYTRISGPNGFIYFANTILSSLSPSQSETSSFSISGVAPSAGTYVVNENATYETSFTEGSNTITINSVSKNFTTSYVITAVSSGSSGGSGLNFLNTSLPEPQANIGSLIFTQMPVLTTIISGNSTITGLGLHNNGTTPIWVNITVPKFNFGEISLSASSIYLLPRQTVEIEIYFYANQSAPTASYVLPVNYTVTSAVISHSSPNIAFKGQFYTGLSIVKPSFNPVFLRSTTLGPGGSLLTQYTVYNPSNIILLNTLLTTRIPASLVKNGTIFLTGAMNNLTLSAGEYLLQWKIPSLQPHGTTFLTYSATNVSIPSYFYTPVTSLSVISTNYTALKIFDIRVPTFYVGKQGNISVSALYTGTNQSSITFILSPPLGITVQNQTRRFDAVPNTALNMTYKVNPINDGGTYIFELYVNGLHVNQSYLIPVVALFQSQLVPTTTAGQASQIGLIGMNATESTFFVSITGILLFIIAMYIVYTRSTYARYDRDRSERLMRMKQRVKMELEKEKNSGSDRGLESDRE